LETDGDIRRTRIDRSSRPASEGAKILITPRFSTASLLALALGACSTTPVPPTSGGHLSADMALPAGPAVKADIPPPVSNTVTLAMPKPAAKVETYSVVVNNIAAQDLLFALARDAKINVDIHPGITGNVTLNAIDQTLPQLLNRIANQIDMRWQMDGGNLVVMPDTPFLRTYKVDYVNMTRDVTSTIASNNSVASASGVAGSSASTTTNQSTTKIDDVVKNRFWETIEKNVKDILHETDKILPEGSSETVIERNEQQSTTGTGAAAGGKRSSAAAPAGLAGSPNPAALQEAGTTVVRRTTFREAASVIVNPEAGVVTVRATSRQHEKVQEYLDTVMASARRQVLIEATIAEVTLNDTYNQGIDWSRLRSDKSGFSVSGTTAGASTVSTMTPFTLGYLNSSSPLNLNITIKALRTFGNVKILSSPKLSVLNNQTAMLRVVENYVYFKVDSSIAAGNANTNALQSITTTPQTVQVGLTMAVTPEISDNDFVILNVRPTITQISKFVQDPNPELTIPNNVPQLRTREIESVLRVNSGDTAVLGGLMEDSIDYNTGRVPLVGAIPLLGEIFTNRANSAQKTELVIFLRPIVVKNASLAGDYSSYRSNLPDKDFFTSERARHQVLPQLPKEDQ
jgi:MSHA type pilus biogenesis protein MshL